MATRIHSSGDYKTPPLPNEHAGLRRYHEIRAGDLVVIPAEWREAVGQAILAKLRKREVRVLAVAVAATHSHWLAELSVSEKEVRLIVGECKSASSHAIRRVLLGRVLASGGEYLRVKDRAHQLNVYKYVLNQQNAWIWDFKNPRDKSNQAPGRGTPNPGDFRSTSSIPGIRSTSRTGLGCHGLGVRAGVGFRCSGVANN